MAKTKYNLHCLKGREILEHYQYVAPSVKQENRVIHVDEHAIDKTEHYGYSALLHQLLALLKKQEGFVAKDEDALLEYMVFVDFSKAMDESLSEALKRVMLEGLQLQFCNRSEDASAPAGKPMHFVPFEKSSSQTRQCVISFIREDLFAPMREALNLGLEDMDIWGGNRDIKRLSKVYGYRGLYLSGGTLIAGGRDARFADFFSEQNIVVVNFRQFKIEEPSKVEVFTGDPERDKEPRTVAIDDCFDGEGLISPAAAERIHAKLGAKKRGTSFQVRMPFFKGMLHQVDFHRFLADMGIGEEAEIIDAFGVRRKLKDAHILVPVSMFKLYGLHFKDMVAKKAPGADPMAYYFEMVKKYDHGLHVLKTDRNYRNEGFTTLSYQYWSTLHLEEKAFDELVDEHISRADRYTIDGILESADAPNMDPELASNACAQLIQKYPEFANDKVLAKQLEDLRISKYKEVAMGRIAVTGETRVLSRDLLYFLYALGKNADSMDEEVENRLEDVLECCTDMAKGKVYLPDCTPTMEGEAVALLRDPHMARNEDVYATVYKDTNYRKTYFSHLHGVAMVGYLSYMPNALGGADFDGDTVHMITDPRVVAACKHGYAEGEKTGLPFIDIQPLTCKDDSKDKSFEKKMDCAYIDPQVIANTFNSRIGMIAHAAVKLATVEYTDPKPLKCGLNAATCTIMGGTEIDSAKTGIKPDIDGLLQFKGDNAAQRAIVDEVTKFLNVKEILEGLDARKPQVECYTVPDETNQDKKTKRPRHPEEALVLKDKCFASIPFIERNRDLPPVCRLLYRWAELFLDKRETTANPVSTPLPKDKWNCKKSCPDEVHNLLEAFQQTLKEYKKVKRLEAVNNSYYVARIKSILKDQYDNIYRATEGESPNGKYLRLEQMLLNSGLSAAKTEAVFKELYGQGADVFDGTAYWPFLKDGDDRDARLKDLADQLVDRDILTNFRSRGYWLLGYLLKGITNTLAAEEKLELEAVRDAEKLDCEPSSAANRYTSLKREYLTKKIPTHQFQQKLATNVRQDIDDLFPDSNSAEVMQSVYLSLKNKAQRQAFWDIYSCDAVLSRMEGNADAE